MSYVHLLHRNLFLVYFSIILFEESILYSSTLATVILFIFFKYPAVKQNKLKQIKHVFIFYYHESPVEKLLIVIYN